jgi:SAM-dependent methyltransferase
MTATREEIERLLAENKLKYQRVELPYGLVTPGKDRRPSAKLALPENLEGRSVLDVGCNIGFFSFEAERRGATRVLGIDFDPERIREATLLKSVLDSSVEFAVGDVLKDPVGERFDLVLALNVIHHVTDPFSALETLASLTTWRLVIEFPTFAGQYWRKRWRLWRLYNRAPLVGVRSVRSPTKFAFSRSAIERSLVDDDSRPFFSSVRFVDSPLPGRLIAICEKTA